MGRKYRERKNEQQNNKYKLMSIDGKAMKSATDKMSGAIHLILYLFFCKI